MVRSKPWEEVFLSVVTLTFLFFTGFWLIPDKDQVGTLRKHVIEPVRSFILFWGLEQSWALFSPRIRDINYHTAGLVTFEDGSKYIWEPPRMDKLNLVERFRLEKFRKWGVDSLPWDTHKEYWPYLARFVGRQVYNKDNPPVQFSLMLFWAKIPPPTKEEFVSKEKLPAHTLSNHIFTYNYSEEDFR